MICAWLLYSQKEMYTEQGAARGSSSCVYACVVLDTMLVYIARHVLTGDIERVSCVSCVRVVCVVCVECVMCIMCLLISMFACR